MLRLTSPAAKFPARSKRKVETRPGADDLGQYPVVPLGRKDLRQRKAYCLLRGGVFLLPRAMPGRSI